MIRFIPFFFALTLISCSQSFHCRKCTSGTGVIRDTIRLDTTIYIPSVRVDTVIQYDLSTDTLIIEKDRVKIKFKDIPGPTVYLAAECPPDTVIIEKKIPTITEVKVGMSEARHWLTVGVVGLIMLIVGYLVRKLLG